MFKTPVTKKSTFGDTIVEWEEKLRTRANVIYNNSNKTTEFGEMFMTYEVIFQIRYYHHIDDFDIINYNGEDWRIVSIEPQREQQLINIKASKVNE